MKTTRNIDDTVMAELKREAARSRPHDVRTSRDRIAPTACLSTKAGENPRPTQVPQRRSTRRCCRPRCPVPRHGGSLAVDTNVVYAADAPSRPARRVQTFLRMLGIEIAFSREGRAGTRTIRLSSRGQIRAMTDSPQCRQPMNLRPALPLASPCGASCRRRENLMETSWHRSHQGRPQTLGAHPHR
jgi:hypothetical protein